MIKVNVLSEENSWSKKIKKKELFFNKICTKFPKKYRFMINGLVDQNTVFDLSDLSRFPRINKLYFLECAANSGMEWRGAQLNGCQFTLSLIHI